METGELIKKLKQAVPGAVLEKGRFAQFEHPAIWIEARALHEVSVYLSGPAAGLDWLENLSVIQIEGTLVATYFLRSGARPKDQLILRVSVVPASLSKEVDLASVADVWAMATPFEVDAGELFGIRFTRSGGERAHLPSQRLPKGWNGFPLRKNYVFPTEFLGIPHTRKASVKPS